MRNQREEGCLGLQKEFKARLCYENPASKQREKERKEERRTEGSLCAAFVVKCFSKRNLKMETTFQPKIKITL